jgi:hypothetical protein
VVGRRVTERIRVTLAGLGDSDGLALVVGLEGELGCGVGLARAQPTNNPAVVNTTAALAMAVRQLVIVLDASQSDPSPDDPRPLCAQHLRGSPEALHSPGEK